MTLRAVVVTALLAGLSSPGRAADPAQSAMAGDPTWPYVSEVAPSITLQQDRGTPQVTEIDPTWPAESRVVPAGMALRQRPLTDDPLQGWTVWEAAPEETERVACAGPCTCEHG